MPTQQNWETLTSPRLVWGQSLGPAINVRASEVTFRMYHRASDNFAAWNYCMYSVFDIENSELQTLVDTAVQANAGFFDTAERYGSHWKTAFGMGYGETEQMLNKFLSQSSSSSSSSLDPVVATKFTPLPWRTTVESVVEACEESCRRLGVDQIDLYQLHMPDIVQPLARLGQPVQTKDEIYWQGLAECYNRGLVKNVGVCNYGPTLLEQCQDKLAQYNVPLASNQIAYSLIGRHNGAQETVEYCKDHDIKVLAFYPLAMGLLTGKYNPSPNHENRPLSTHSSSLTKSGKTALELYDLQKYANRDNNGGLASLLTVMEEIAQNHRTDGGNAVTIAQVALNYLVCNDIIPIPGARNTVQLRDNVGAMGWRLSAQEVERLESATDSLGLSGFDGAGFKRTSEKFVGYGVEKWSLN